MTVVHKTQTKEANKRRSNNGKNNRVKWRKYSFSTSISVRKCGSAQHRSCAGNKIRQNLIRQAPLLFHLDESRLAVRRRIQIEAWACDQLLTRSNEVTCNTNISADTTYVSGKVRFRYSADMRPSSHSGQRSAS